MKHLVSRWPLLVAAALLLLFLLAPPALGGDASPVPDAGPPLWVDLVRIAAGLVGCVVGWVMRSYHVQIPLDLAKALQAALSQILGGQTPPAPPAPPAGSEDKPARPFREDA
jgi:hypothetical protein